MHCSVDRDDVQRLPAAGAQVVEMLPAEEYDWPSTPAAELLERMKQRGFENSFVTDSNGLLWGLVVRVDLEWALGERRP